MENAKKIKHKYFIDILSVIRCQNSEWIIDWRIYGEGTQIPFSFTRYRSFGKDPG